MKVYLGAAVSAGRVHFPQLNSIKAKLEEMGVGVYGGALKKEIMPGEEMDPKKLYQREIKILDKCDVMVAEVSLPSWGTAFLMEYALKHKKPVLALFFKQWQENGLPVMIKGHPRLFSEIYNEETIKSILKHQFKFFKSLQKRKGKFVAIEGVDGSGKTTQVKRLAETLKKKGYKIRIIDFPRYYTSFHGEIITRMLRGEFGSMDEVSPYLASLAYALDRLTARKQIREWLEDGYLVIANRYTGSNMAHQSAKLPVRQRSKFFKWVDEMEYQMHKIPREDMTIFLDVPVEISRAMIKKKKQRKYLKKEKEDIAEKDRKHQAESYKSYLMLCKKNPKWQRVMCVNRKKEILSVDEISQKILEVLEQRKIV